MLSSVDVTYIKCWRLGYNQNLYVFTGVVDEISEGFYFGTKEGPSGSDDEQVKFARLDCSHFILIESHHLVI